MRKNKFFFVLAGVMAVAVSGCLRVGSRQKVPPEAGVFISQSKGELWQARARLVVPGGLGTLGGVSVGKMFIDPQDYRAIYLTTAGAGLVYTYDGGTTWQQPPDVVSGTVNDVAVDPRRTCTVYLGLGSRALKSDDCNRSYREIYLDPRPNAVTAVAVDGANSNILFLGTSLGELLRSSNGGASWSRVYNFGSGVQWLVFDPANPKRAYALTAQAGMFRSTDGAASWQSLRQGLLPFSQGEQIRSLQFVLDQPNTLFLLNRYGILRSADGGDTWSALALITPPLSADILAFAVNPANSKEIYYATASTFYSSPDGGGNWVTRRLPGRRAVPQAMFIHPRNVQTIFLGLSITPN